MLQLAEFSQVDEKGERYALPGEYSALLSLLPRRAATCLDSGFLSAQPSTLASAESTPANTAWATRSTRSRWSEGRPPSRNGKDLAQRCFARPVIG